MGAVFLFFNAARKQDLLYGAADVGLGEGSAPIVAKKKITLTSAHQKPLVKISFNMVFFDHHHS